MQPNMQTILWQTSSSEEVYDKPIFLKIDEIRNNTDMEVNKEVDKEGETMSFWFSGSVESDTSDLIVQTDILQCKNVSTYPSASGSKMTASSVNTRPAK